MNRQRRPMIRHQGTCKKERILIIKEITDNEKAEAIVEENNSRPIWKKLDRIVSEDHFLVESAREIFQLNGIPVTSTIF